MRGIELEADREIVCEKGRKIGREKGIGRDLVNVTEREKGRELGHDHEKTIELEKGGVTPG